MAATKEVTPRNTTDPRDVGTGVYIPPPDPQPALHALDVYRANIGGNEPRSPEQVVACDEAHDTLDEYFAAKDAIVMPAAGEPHMQASAAGPRDPINTPLKAKSDAKAEAKA